MVKAHAGPLSLTHNFKGELQGVSIDFYLEESKHGRITSPLPNAAPPAASVDSMANKPPIFGLYHFVDITQRPPRGEPSQKPFPNAAPSTGDCWKPSKIQGSNISDEKSWNASMSSLLWNTLAGSKVDSLLNTTGSKAEPVPVRLSDGFGAAPVTSNRKYIYKLFVIRNQQENLGNSD